MNKEKANVNLYMVLSMMPLAYLYPLRKIEKIRKGIAMYLLISVGCVGFYAISPAEYVPVLSYITSAIIMALFVRKWSIEWNQSLLQETLK